jgi:MFS transporter, ACS family, glucarate transporter
MKHRNRVLGLLASLSVLTYVDRVCISVAGPRLQGDLHLSPQDWGLVSGAFAIAYMLFEIPSGHLADRFGARLMVTRIVLWWSAFTALTGLASALWPLVVIRFLFGVGEAGAYPTASTSVFR